MSAQRVTMDVDGGNRNNGASGQGADGVRKGKRKRNRKRGGGRGTACFNCGGDGHFARDCPTAPAAGAAPGGKGTKRSKRQTPKDHHRPQAQPTMADCPMTNGEAQQGRGKGLPRGEGKGAAPESRTTSTTRSALTATRFDSFPLLKSTLSALQSNFGYDSCTQIQAQAIPKAISTYTTHDLIAKAKTGTGKTLAFLIPALEVLARRPVPPGCIGVLCVSPTRELAQQIAEEAKGLGVSVDTVVGGTNMKAEIRRLRSQAPAVLVGTPGRLNDHLANADLKGKMSQLRVLILDEADRLLDMGFRPDLGRMVAQLPPPETRFGQLFSATFPDNVKDLAGVALRGKYNIIDTVGSTAATAARVAQYCCIVEARQMGSALLAVIEDEKRQHPRDFKIMAFFTTARLTQYYSELFVTAGVPVLEMHSRKSQSHRTRVAKTFRDSRSAIMFTSDVSARGMDYPDVALVIQVGLPSDKQQYVHRVGRTARADASGRALLLLAPFESVFVTRKLRGLPIQNATPESLLGEPRHATALQSRVDGAARALPQKTRAMAYQAYLGFYNSNLKQLGWRQADLVEAANTFAREQLLCSAPPPLLARTIGKMGLRAFRKRYTGQDRVGLWDGLRAN